MRGGLKPTAYVCLRQGKWEPGLDAIALHPRDPPLATKKTRALCWSVHFVRKWRNWQTRKPQELVAARSWRFESSLPHQMTERPDCMIQQSGVSTNPGGHLN